MSRLVPPGLLGLLLTALLALAKDKPFPPAEAARHMTVPAGFHVTLFAGEPDLVQPIAFTFDDRGRLWVAEISAGCRQANNSVGGRADSALMWFGQFNAEFSHPRP